MSAHLRVHPRAEIARLESNGHGRKREERVLTGRFGGDKYEIGQEQS